MKEFNTTSACNPSDHYMVDITERVAKIKELVDSKKYFTINRARQYGKTTTLSALYQALLKDYTVLFLDFQGIDKDVFESGATFSQAIARLILDLHEFENVPIPESVVAALKSLNDSEITKVKMDDLFRVFKRWIKQSDRPIVLIIDEVDSASNNQVFLDFLAQLRDGYTSRNARSVQITTFHSVILAGVTALKHLKGKIRPNADHKLNSPWNIAADFDIDMSLSEGGIKGMLDEYETDHHTGMDTALIAKEIRAYTNGYPFLVSRICQLIDTKLVPQLFKTSAEAWTRAGVDEAVRLILSEENTLFESVMGKLEDAPELKGQLRNIILRGETIANLPDDEEQKQLRMYGFIRNNHNTVAVANRIYEMRLYNYFIGESKKNSDLKQLAAANKSIFVDADGWLNIPKIMEHFIRDHNIIHKDEDESFLEKEGRERFLTYLAPIINGTGTFSVEEQTRDHRRMDVVIHYLGRRYIIELKIWHGDRYNEKGEQQIMDYLDSFALDTGYLLSFSFNKKKESGVKRINIENKVLFEGIV